MTDDAGDTDAGAPDGDDVVEVEPTADAPKRKTRRTWPQRLTITALFVGALACFVAAVGVFAAQQVLEDRQLITIDDPGALDSGLVFGSTTTGPAGSESTVPPETFPPAEPDAQNFLVTGADNNACIDEDSPYKAAFGDRDSLGERSDTIMMWRVNPSTSQVAVLSFPRDLLVTIAGRSSKAKINSAYERDDPQRLIDTIYQNFGIVTDHYIQIDFCAFKTLVDAVDGVTVPFDHAVRDVKTGLYVPQPGCFTFTGDHALAYVRSRALELYDQETDTWHSDNAYDLGRISRQQDFIRRVIQRLLDTGAYKPDVVRGLVDASTDYVVTDDGLSPRKILEFAGVVRNIDPAAITTYQIQSYSDMYQGQSVQIPQINGDNMQAVLSVFQGTATLGEAPEQVFETTVPEFTSTTTTEAPLVTTTTSPGGTTATTGTVEPVPYTTLPAVTAEEIVYGWRPDPNVKC